MAVCPNCREDNPDKFRVCGFCGTPLVAPVASEVRKTVTILFCDLKGSTALGERLDSETLREILGRYFDAMKNIIESHGGTVEKFIGDAVMAVFGLPRLHEDDALRACRAAWEMQRALERLNEELTSRWGATLANRIGVNTGEVVADDASTGQRLVTGDPVNVAARLEQAAGEMQTLIGQPTYDLVRDAVEVDAIEPLTLKGKSQRIPAYQLNAVRGGIGVARRLERPMVGREAELAVVRGSFDRAVVASTCEVVTIVGEAGLGKTRLVEAFLASVIDDATVLRGHCLSYGDGITFWPLAEVVRHAAAIVESDEAPASIAKLGALLGADAANVIDRLAVAMGLQRGVFPIQETYWAATKFAEAVARHRPLVIVFDDIHWAETTMLELIAHLAGAVAAPVLVVNTARPDLIDDHPRWLRDSPKATTIALSPLSDGDSGRIVENILGRIGLPAPVQERIAKAAEGNPLFIEQIVSSFIDDGLLHVDPTGGWTVNEAIANAVVPPTISALLAARVDRLPPEEKAVLETGSVAGAVFHQRGVEELAPGPLRERVPEMIESLSTKQLLHPVESTFPDDSARRFHHALLRDAAYQRLLKRTRAELHERYGDWLVRIVGARMLEFEEIVGYHLEQAYRLRGELGPLDEKGIAIGVQASARLAAAGRRAIARGDIPAAANLVERAMSVLPEGDRGRIELAVDLGETLREKGDFTRAADILRGAMDGAAALGDVPLRAALTLVDLLVRKSTDPTGWEETALEETRRAIEVFDAAADHASLARAWRLLGNIHGGVGRFEAGRESVERAIAEARSAGDRRQETRSLPVLGLCLLYGPAPTDRAIAQCEELLASAHGDQRAEAMLMNALAQLYAMRGDFERARSLYRRGRATLEDLGARVQAAAVSIYSGRVELLAGDPVAAEQRMRPAYETFRQMGERATCSTLAAILGEALYQQGRYEEAEALSRVSEEIASKDDFDAQYRWRALRAKTQVLNGAVADAEATAREAVRIVQQSDSPVEQAAALLALGTVLRQSGRSAEATPILSQALNLFEAKGDMASVRQIGQLIDGPRSAAIDQPAALRGAQIVGEAT
jgi:class 3 adenylate cyclase/tetratricopeptide (TPR) repeat protein